VREEAQTRTVTQARGAVLGLASAALFGLSAPMAKLLLGTTPPVLLAGLLYLGAAAGLWLLRLARPSSSEARLVRGDVPKLAAVVIAGGIIGPVLMLLGLNRVTALTASLLLNLEAPFTVLLAVVVFREHLGAYGAAAVALILGGALILKLEPGALGADTAGVALLAAACFCWAVDNNLTQRLTLRDPFAIVRVKTLVAGVFNTALGLLLAEGEMPEAGHLAGALLLGSLSYGISVVLDAYALRLVGAAREAAYFATAPFLGALGSLALLRDPLRWFAVAAMVSMAAGVALLLRERHRHLHTHEELEHEHLHEHDAHHRHQHGPGDSPGEPHSHLHRHGQLIHDHPHLPDAHHRHEH
jgi:drug/metabolite transporter (DMT)-like permease